MQKTWLWSLGQEDPLEKGMATHFSILTWSIQWTNKAGRLQSMGSWGVGHDWATDSWWCWVFHKWNVIRTDWIDALRVSVSRATFSFSVCVRQCSRWWLSISLGPQMKTTVWKQRNETTLSSMKCWVVDHWPQQNIGELLWSRCFLYLCHHENNLKSNTLANRCPWALLL